MNGTTIYRVTLGSLFATALIVPAFASARSDMKAGYDAMRRQDYGKAIMFFTSAIQTGDLTRANLALAYHYRGVEYLKTGRYDEAIADLDQAIMLEPVKLPTAYSDRGIAYRKKGDYAKAIADYTQAIRLWPDWHDWYLNRGLAYAANNQYADAIADFGRALYYRPELPTAYIARGDAYLALDRKSEALADYKRAQRHHGSLLEQYPGLAAKIDALDGGIPTAPK
jgi:tetratricopeptide (TPR) repeat protein